MTKTQIVYYSSLNFHTIIPYRDLVARNRLAVRAAGDVLRYKTTEEENRGPSVIGELIFDLAITKVSKATD